MRGASLRSGSQIFKQNLRLLYRPGFLLTTFTRQSAGIESNNMIALEMICLNSNPLFCASRKSNQHSALCIRIHFNLYGIVLGSFGSYRGVSIDISTGSIAAMKHVCRPSRTPIPPAMSPPSKVDEYPTLIRRDKDHQTIRVEYPHSFCSLRSIYCPPEWP